MEEKYSKSTHEIYSGECSVKYSDTPQSPKFNMHVHDAYEITLILSDDVEVFINDTSYPVPNGSILLFNTMDAHRIKYTGSTSYRRFVLWFKQDFLSEFNTLSYKLLRCFFLRNFERSNLLCLSDERLQEVLVYYNRLRQIKTNKSFMQNERLKLTLAEFLIFLNDLYLTQNVDNLPAYNSDYIAVYKAILYIQENYAKDISRKTLSALTGINERALCEYFKSVTGMTTNQYILTFRLSAAKNLLIKGLPATAVSEKTGFDNYSNFSRTFKKHVGLSPKQYAMQFSDIKDKE